MSAIVAAIIQEAQNQGVDPRVALEQAIQESQLDPNAVSAAGAIGLFQLEPSTAADLGVDPTDPAQNIQGGIRYYNQLLSKYGDPALALGAYDWGEGHVDTALARYGADWLSHAPLETQNYVATILGNVATKYQPLIAPIQAARAVQQAAAANPAAANTIGKVLLGLGLAIMALFAFNAAMRESR
jgi:soluble lytic murein transglycosylase-like protein